MEVSGAKNAAVAILPAVVLSDGICRIENIPNIADVASSLEILAHLGARVRRITRIQWRSTPAGYLPLWFITIWPANEGVLLFYRCVAGALWYRRVSMPGGCNFGVRPIDQHLKGFTALGAEVSPMEQGMIEVTAQRLVGNSIYLDMVSVGATVNIMLAAVRARGTTVN